MKDIKVDFTAREKLIAECEFCEGKPKEEPFELEGMKGIKCGTCLQVVSWEGEFKTAKKKKKVANVVEKCNEVPKEIKENTIYNTDTFLFTKEFKKNTFDLVMEDIPYGESYQSNNRKDKHEAIDNDDNLDWLPEHISELHRIMKNNRHCYIFCGKKIDIIKPIVEKKFPKVQILTWVKGGSMGDLEAEFSNSTEFILLCQKGRRKLNGKRAKNVFNHNVLISDTREHPTPKPVNLIRELIKYSSNKDELIFDGFSGRGTVAIAAIMENRKFIASELMTKYHEISLKNVELAQKKIYSSNIKIKDTKNDLGEQASLF